MTDQVVAKIKKNALEEIRVGLQEWNGHQLASVRVWWKADDGAMKPGKAGINFRIDILPEVVEGLNEAIREARAQGLIK